MCGGAFNKWKCEYANGGVFCANIYGVATAAAAAVTVCAEFVPTRMRMRVYCIRPGWAVRSVYTASINYDAHAEREGVCTIT